jgi:hypothetical protein
MDGLENTYIFNTLRDLSQDFRGIFSCDNLPEELLTRDKFIVVCNLSKQFELGTHYVTIVSHETQTIYIDSFGYSCTNVDIAAFLQKRGGQLYYNKRAFQHLQSVHCGFYSIFFTLLFDSLNAKPKNNFYFSSTDLLSNDKRCIRYIKLLIAMRNK